MKNIIFLFLVAMLSFSLQAQKNNQAIYVEVTGQGDPVLLIPGFTVPGDSWEAVVKQLEKSHECHVVTLAGFGGKEPIEFPWLPKVNEALEDYIRMNELNDITVIGHSLGGTVATWLASREGSKLSKIILVDALPASGAIMFPNFNPDYLKYDSPYNNQQLAMNEADFEQLANNMSKGMSTNSDAQKQIKKWILEADRKTYVYGYTDYLKLDLREDLKNISIPVSIIAADQPYGKEMIIKTYKDQYANLHDYNLVVAENAAHFIMYDKPEWFMDQIQRILLSKE